MRHDKALQYLQLAQHFATIFSKDPSTRVGALLLHPTDFTILSAGYNGMPRGCRDTLPERQDRPLKYEYFEHAERNTAFNAVREQLIGSIAISSCLPDMNCARALISVGSQILYLPDDALRDNLQDRALQLLDEAQVEVLGFSRIAQRFPTFAQSTRVDSAASQDSLRRAWSEMQLAMQDAGPDANSATCFLSPSAGWPLLALGVSGVPEMFKHLHNLAIGSEGAARSAIYGLAEKRLKGSIGVVTLCPCLECARGWLMCGVRGVVTAKPPAELVERWGAQFEQSRSLFAQCGVPLSEVASLDA